jgi:homoserine dehydrogenase
MEKPLNIAIAGLGTIGGGTLKIIRENASLLKERSGREIRLVAVLDRDRKKLERLKLEGVAFVESPKVLAAMPEVDVIVELMGGAEGAAKELVESALKAGKHVVTANKALIAHHGVALAKLAEKSGKVLAYEAAVAGGIPIIKSLREGLAANHFSKIAGILNGTCNFILTSMKQEHKDFGEALKEAQQRGFAEADPSFDIDGVDTAHKLAILTSLAYGVQPDIDAVYVEGIRNITIPDIEFADQLGFIIKLLGISQRVESKILQRVHPCMVGKDTALGRVSGAYNGIIVEGSSVGRITFEGRGAGEGPTASAVVADIMDIARGAYYRPFTIAAEHLKKAQFSDMDSLRTSYYLRLSVADKPGVLAAITGVFSKEGISVDSFLQHPPKSGETAQVVITTHETVELHMRHAIKSIAALDSVTEPPHMIRMENL